MHTVSVRPGEILQQQGAPIREVFFPTGGVFSILKLMEDGSVAEVAMIGCEGFLGAELAFGQTEAGGQVSVLIADGPVYSIGASAFLSLMDARGALHDRVLAFEQTLIGQIQQIVACNSLHPADRRVARWLLTVHDRIKRDEFPVTHECLARMLGVRRPTVTLISQALQAAGAIRYRRGHVTIVSREKLEAASCECYRVMSAAFRRLVAAA